MFLQQKAPTKKQKLFFSLFLLTGLALLLVRIIFWVTQTIGLTCPSWVKIRDTFLSEVGIPKSGQNPAWRPKNGLPSSQTATYRKREVIQSYLRIWGRNASIKSRLYRCSVKKEDFSTKNGAWHPPKCSLCHLINKKYVFLVSSHGGTKKRIVPLKIEFKAQKGQMLASKEPFLGPPRSLDSSNRLDLVPIASSRSHWLVFLDIMCSGNPRVPKRGHIGPKRPFGGSTRSLDSSTGIVVI